MPILTISREFGSGGGEMAQKVAQSLGYHLADKRTFETILRAYGLVEFGKEYDTLPSFWDHFNTLKMERREILIGTLNQAILALAGHGRVVLVGRGNFAVLRGFADVLHVRVQAPLSLRVKRVIEQQPELAGSSVAEALVKENDRLQKVFVETVYGAQWESIKAFDLTIDTQKVPLDLAASWLVQAVKVLPAAGTPHLRTTAELQVDRILAAAVADVFACPSTHVN